MNVKLAWKADNFGPKAPHIVVQYTAGRYTGTYGVWVAVGGSAGRPVGSGRGIASLDSAIEAAQNYNRSLNTAIDCG